MAKKLKLSPQQEAERLFIEGAILMTKLRGPMRRAVTRVLLEGWSVIDATKKARRGNRSNVYRAIAAVKKHVAALKATP